MKENDEVNLTDATASQELLRSSSCFTSCVVARRHRLAARIGRLVRQSLGVVAGFVGFLVLDEDFSHQLLGTGQRDPRLQLHDRNPLAEFS